MVITYYGVACIKVQSGEAVYAFDPPAKQSAARTPRFQADVVFISSSHPLHSGKDALGGKDNAPIVLEHPGEYEIGGVAIRAVQSWRNMQQSPALQNTIYVATIEELRLCHLGGFGEGALRPETKADIGSVDILFLPLGANGLAPETAAKIVNDIEPRITIPLYHAPTNTPRVLDAFLKEAGAENEKPAEKLTIKKKEVAVKESAVVLLQPQLA